MKGSARQCSTFHCCLILRDCRSRPHLHRHHPGLSAVINPGKILRQQKDSKLLMASIFFFFFLQQSTFELRRAHVFLSILLRAGIAWSYGGYRPRMFWFPSAYKSRSHCTLVCEVCNSIVSHLTGRPLASNGTVSMKTSRTV